MTEENAIADEIAAFVKERDEMLLAADIDKALAFAQKWNPGAVQPSREVMEISLHKARTAARSLPLEERQKSKRWLLARNYLSFDDGDL